MPVKKEALREELKKIIKEKSLQTNAERVLTSARRSNYYVDCNRR